MGSWGGYHDNAVMIACVAAVQREIYGRLPCPPDGYIIVYYRILKQQSYRATEQYGYPDLLSAVRIVDSALL